MSLAPAPPPSGARPAALGRAVALALGTGTAVLLVHRTGGTLAFPACPFLAVTGWWCPFCGGTRAVAALTDGNLPAALSFNVLAVVIVVAGVVLWARHVVLLVRGRPAYLPDLSPRRLAILGLVLLAFTVWRNLPALPLSGWLAP